VKSAHNLLHWCLLVVVVLVLGGAMIGGAPAFAATGTATSSATPSNASPTVGQQIVVTINIDVSNVNAPDNYLGGFTGTLDWNTAVLAFVDHTALPGGFAGNINHTSSGTGHITFNGANSDGASGNVTIFTATFDVVGAGTSALDLAYSAMAAATTYANLLPLLTVNDGQVVASPVQYTLTAGNDGHGTVTLNPAGGTYAAGTTVTLTPVPNSGYVFSSWSGANAGDIINTGGVYTIVMNGNKSVTANFIQVTYTLTAGNDGHGTVTLNPAGGTYAAGTTVTLTPVPNSGYVFSSWSGANAGDIINTGGVYTMVINGNKSVTANFIQVTYTLTAGNDGHGTVTLYPAGGTYAAGTTVTLTPVPNSGYVFSSWSGANAGDIINTGGVYTIVMNGNKSVTANFTLKTYTLTVSKSGTGSGTVTSSPSGINCGADCSEAYNHNTEVTLSAAAATGSTFSGWSGACSGTGACVVTMTEARSVTGNFTLKTYTLTVGKSGTGSGTVTSSPSGINCGADCSEAYSYNTAVTLSAAAATGSTFSGWSGTCSGTGACSVTSDADKTVTAHFTQITSYNLTTAVSPTGGGTTVPAVGVHAYASGTIVAVTATPAAGYTFSSWGGACTGTGSCSVTMDADKTVTANFTKTYDLTMAVDPAGGGTTNPAVGLHTYPAGTRVATITATPAPGYQFGRWSGACTGTGSCSATMDADKTITAHFTPITYDLTMAVDPIGAGTTNPALGVHAYAPGSVVNVTATPSNGHAFDHWSGACAGTGSCSVTMDADKTVTAHFTGISHNLTVAVSPVGGGTTDPAVGIHAIAAGTVVNVTATPAGGYKFDSWTGACTGSGACSVTMDAAKTVTAHFAKLAPDLSLTKADGGGVAKAGDTISYSLTYSNAGGNATGVVIKETVPANTTFNSAASTSGWACQPNGNAGSACAFSLGQVANAGGGAVTFAVTVAGPLPIGMTQISNTAGIGDDGSGGADSNPADNTASAQTLLKHYLNYLPLTSKN
jgi:uncharacterized repeat protein (TIGR01451 family)/uncharacterized repeat protein (TIGR02543 family)